MTTPMHRLRAVDPARHADLDSLDPAAWSALHVAVLASAPGHGPASTPGRRWWRPGRSVTITLTVGVALTAGGLAVVPGFLGGTDGANCLRTWGTEAEVSGPLLTGDPVVDCLTYWEQAGIEPPGDLVGFTVGGLPFAAPAGEVPPGAVALEGAPALTPAELELQQSALDLVDGGMVCRSVDEEAAWAQAELDRLGLADRWTVSVAGYPDEPHWTEDGIERPCAGVMTSVPGLATVIPAEDPAVVMFPDGNWRADLLRDRITDRCVTLDEARAVVDEMLADEVHHWPATSVLDESAECARVDLTIGGSIQVTVYGPTSVG